MTENAFMWIVVIMLCISNFQTFLIFGVLTVLNKNTEWGRYVMPTQIEKMTGGNNNDTTREGI